MIIIDYLQLMSAKDGKGGGNREQEISTISRSIKEIAKEIKGGGGGQPFFATAGGNDVSGLKNAVEKGKSFVV
jgi:alanyl-tRNA synthetase